VTGPGDGRRDTDGPGAARRRRAKAAERPGRASAARRLALEVLHDVDGSGAFVNLALDEALEASGLDPADRALATELAYGVTRWRGRLDWVLDHLCSRPMGELPAWIRNILRMGLYQMLYLERIPDRAAVWESVALAHEFGHRGTVGLVNAVLRQAALRGGSVPLPPAGPDPAERLAVEWSHPRWLVARWLDRYGPERTAALCAADNEAAPLTLRCNLLRTTREGLLARLESEGTSGAPGGLFAEAVVYRGPRPLRELEAYRAGLFAVQAEGAMAVARAVAPRPGWLVVDACAGVGGKTTHLAELMDDQGRVVALDLFEHKLRLLAKTAARLGLGCVETRCLDARSLPASDLAGVADAVLVDAPCSGLGVLRRRPDLRWRVTESDLAALAGLQAALLAAAAACVKPGGVLVYATCTLEPEENQRVVEGFLASNLEFDADDAAGAAGLDPAGDGFETVGPRGLGRSGRPGGSLLFVPRSGGPDGFYVCRLVRLGGTA